MTNPKIDARDTAWSLKMSLLCRWFYSGRYSWPHAKTVEGDSEVQTPIVRSIPHDLCPLCLEHPSLPIHLFRALNEYQFSYIYLYHTRLPRDSKTPSHTFSQWISELSMHCHPLRPLWPHQWLMCGSMCWNRSRLTTCPRRYVWSHHGHASANPGRKFRYQWVQQ